MRDEERLKCYEFVRTFLSGIVSRRLVPAADFSEMILAECSLLLSEYIFNEIDFAKSFESELGRVKTSVYKQSQRRYVSYSKNGGEPEWRNDLQDVLPFYARSRWGPKFVSSAYVDDIVNRILLLLSADMQSALKAVHQRSTLPGELWSNIMFDLCFSQRNAE